MRKQLHNLTLIGADMRPEIASDFMNNTAMNHTVQ
jgi:hypothetical protein